MEKNVGCTCAWVLGAIESKVTKQTTNVEKLSNGKVLAALALFFIGHSVSDRDATQ
jgi:hypothetical protein